MGRTYYETLGVAEDASFQDLAKAFRVLAVTYHPQKNLSNMADANFKFTKICEAFEVLSTPELREAYDRWGEDRLKNGIPGAMDGQQAYSFSGDPHEVFENFFGTNNPFHIALDNNGAQVELVEKIQADIHREAVTDRNETHAADLELRCQCTLSEFFYGSTKVIEFSRQGLFGDNKSVKTDGIKREIEIKPGMRAGTVLRFPGEGNQPVYQKQGDLIVVLEEIEHPTIRRDGNNLIYRHSISLQDALNAAPVEFKTLCGETIKFTADEIISPQTEKVFPGKGMPIYNDDPLAPLMANHRRGSFILRFQIEFPQHLNEAQKNKLVDVLSQ